MILSNSSFHASKNILNLSFFFSPPRTYISSNISNIQDVIHYDRFLSIFLKFYLKKYLIFISVKVNIPMRGYLYNLSFSIFYFKGVAKILNISHKNEVKHHIICDVLYIFPRISQFPFECVFVVHRDCL